MNPLRVCILTETYYPVVGGGETQARMLADALVANGIPTIVLTRRSDSLLKKHEKYGEVHIYRLPPVGKGQLKKWGLILSSVPALLRLHRQYDLLFVSGFRIVGIAAVLVSWLLHKICILKADSQGEMSGTFFLNGLKRYGRSGTWAPFNLFLNLRNKVLRHADAFSAISADIAAEFTSAGIDPDRVHLIPNSVDTSRFFPVTPLEKIALRQKIALPQEGTLVIYTGRLVSYKGLPLLLRVWREISRKYGQVHLLLVGTGGLDIHNCEAELQGYVRANHLEGCVHFTGSVQSVPEYLQAADIFAFPTEDDALPSALIEAMACALPVVTTPVGAIKTMIKDGQNGLLVQPGDYQQLYQSIDQLISGPALASRLGQAARETVQAHYAAGVVMQQYLSLFQSIYHTRSGKAFEKMSPS